MNPILICILTFVALAFIILEVVLCIRDFKKKRKKHEEELQDECEPRDQD